MNRYIRYAAIYAALMGIAPLAWPEHDTWADPLTWLDWALHLAGAVYLITDLRRHYGHWTIGQLLGLDSPPPSKDHPTMLPNRTYHVTMTNPDGTPAIIPAPDIVFAVPFRHIHLCKNPENADNLMLLATDRPEGPEDVTLDVLATFDRIGSAIWIDDVHADVLYERRES